MKVEYKLIAFAIVCLTTVLLCAVAYNLSDSQAKVAAYRECVATNERMVNVVAKTNDRSISVPTCYFR